MHSYGHAEVERLQSLQRDVDRILANAETTAEPAGVKHVEPTAPTAAENPSGLGHGRVAERGLDAVVPHPTEGSARLALKRKGRSCSRSRNEDCHTEVAARSSAPRFRAADHRLCRQVRAAVSSILQQAVASKEREWKRRNFLGKRTSLHVPSPPRSMLRTCELNNFVCWAVEEVQDYSPEYLALLNSTLQNLMAYGADPAPAGPQVALRVQCSGASLQRSEPRSADGRVRRTAVKEAGSSCWDAKSASSNWRRTLVLRGAELPSA